MNNKSNLTEVLIMKEATEAMVNDFNLANQDIKSLKIEDLTLVSENIIKLIASLEDLQRTVKEEIKVIEENNVETKVSNILKGYVNKNNDSTDTLSNIKSTSNADKKKEVDGVNFHDLVRNKLDSCNPNPLKKENNIDIPDEILKAVEIAKKYKIGIPYIENGTIIDFVKSGNANIDEVKKSIIELFMSLLDSGCTLDKSDEKYMMKAITKELHLDDFIKSLIHSVPLIRVMDRNEGEKIQSMLSNEQEHLGGEKLKEILQMF